MPGVLPILVALTNSCRGLEPEEGGSTFSTFHISCDHDVTANKFWYWLSTVVSHPLGYSSTHPEYHKWFWPPSESSLLSQGCPLHRCFLNLIACEIHGDLVTMQRLRLGVGWGLWSAEAAGPGTTLWAAGLFTQSAPALDFFLLDPRFLPHLSDPFLPKSLHTFALVIINTF